MAPAYFPGRLCYLYILCKSGETLNKATLLQPRSLRFIGDDEYHIQTMCFEVVWGADESLCLLCLKCAQQLALCPWGSSRSCDEVQMRVTKAARTAEELPRRHTAREMGRCVDHDHGSLRMWHHPPFVLSQNVWAAFAWVADRADLDSEDKKSFAGCVDRGKTSLIQQISFSFLSFFFIF